MTALIVVFGLIFARTTRRPMAALVMVLGINFAFACGWLPGLLFLAVTIDVLVTA